MGSYPIKSIQIKGGESKAIYAKDPELGVIGSVVVQLVFSGGYNGTVKVERRLTGLDRIGLDTAPWYETAYRNEVSQSDVNAGTAVSAAGIIKVVADGADIRLSASGGSAGVLTVAYHCIAG